MRKKDFKTRYYTPSKGLVLITSDYVARFFGFPSVERTWNTREPLRAVGSVKESMPKDAYQDMYRCMHFSNDWEEDWDVEEGTDK